MPRGDPEPACERLQALFLKRARLDACVSGGRETGGLVDGSQPRRPLGPAKQERPKTGGFRGCGGWPKRAVLALRCARWANAAAIDARGLHADVEAAVEALVFSDARR